VSGEPRASLTRDPGRRRRAEAGRSLAIQACRRRTAPAPQPIIPPESRLHRRLVNRRTVAIARRPREARVEIDGAGSRKAPAWVRSTAGTIAPTRNPTRTICQRTELRSDWGNRGRMPPNARVHRARSRRQTLATFKVPRRALRCNRLFGAVRRCGPVSVPISCTGLNGHGIRRQIGIQCKPLSAPVLLAVSGYPAGTRGQPSFATNLCDSATYRSVRRMPCSSGNASITSETTGG